MGGDDKFRIHELIFCVVVFSLISAGHVLALAVETSQEIEELQEQLDTEGLTPGMRAEIEGNLDNASNIDFWDVLGGFGSILFGIDLPLPWPIVLTAINAILLLDIALIIWSFIKAHIPFISG
jgi:hypothetical protein